MDYTFLYITIPIVVSLLIIIPVVRNYLYKRRWERIESLNQKVNINRDNAYIDDKGYLRWKIDDALCHRDIVFDAEVADGNRIENFASKDVHHKDGNKLNDNPENLEILNREKHQEEHGQIIYDSGKKYIKLARVSKIYRETNKAILVARQWIPKSQIIVKDGVIYLPEWLYNEKFRSNVDS
jgi:hypothetical protein